MRPAEEDGVGALQAIHLFEARTLWPRQHDQSGEAHGRERAAGGVGYPRRGDPRASGAPQPRADPASPRHPSFRADADRRQGDPAPSAGLYRVQRRFRRRPDGGARAAVARGSARSARADDVDQQHPLARQRQADHRAVAGHHPRPLLHHDGRGGREGRGHVLHRYGRDRARARQRFAVAACQGQRADLGR
jgi:hypothetical protein